MATVVHYHNQALPGVDAAWSSSGWRLTFRVSVHKSWVRPAPVKIPGKLQTVHGFDSKIAPRAALTGAGDNIEEAQNRRLLRRETGS